jgi:hypothetical protein
MDPGMIRAKLPTSTSWYGFTGDGAHKMLQHCKDKNGGGVCKLNASVGLVFVPPSLVRDQLKEIATSAAGTLRMLLENSSGTVEAESQVDDDCDEKTGSNGMGPYVVYGFTHPA